MVDTRISIGQRDSDRGESRYQRKVDIENPRNRYLVSVLHKITPRVDRYS